MRKFMTLAACAVLTAGTSGVAMADGAKLYTDKLCHTCHGADGKTTIMPEYPKIAGQNEKYIVDQIKAIRDGKRTSGLAAAMKPMAANVSDDEAKEIAKWLASQ
uniref:Cytochrome c553 n=1 Tax=Candidatus Kentrum sp. LFY TaxID=2126342 RepID=A0A450WCD7_9GAMM|nr:MAG: Cytochrome c553 [Candidatus Kentron sp. LFY]VFJ95869.1 MAG: Cytochrome c553 [Candidatus Kentron sp. LFY]VFK14729.1 MAG: Cytochrome c553 [Candidatus Kentron sp. LFY]